MVKSPTIYKNEVNYCKRREDDKGTSGERNEERPHQRGGRQHAFGRLAKIKSKIVQVIGHFGQPLGFRAGHHAKIQAPNHYPWALWAKLWVARLDIISLDPGFKHDNFGLVRSVLGLALDYSHL